MPDNMPPSSAHIANGYFGIDIPFMSYIGLIPELFSPELTRTRMPYRKQISNTRGEIHGGTLLSALDLTLSPAARAHHPSTKAAKSRLTPRPAGRNRLFV